MRILMSLWNLINGYKTYIVTAVGIIYTITRVWTGEIALEAAFYAILGFLGMGTVRHSVAKNEATMLEVRTEVESD